MTEHLLSSRSTFFMKYVFPAIWIPAFGAVAWLVVRAPAEFVADGVRIAVPPVIRWIFLAGWIMGVALILRTVLPLKRVRQADGALLVSNFFRECRVPLAAVAEVTQSRWQKGRPVRVRLHADFGMGTSFTYLPATRLRLRSWREDPEVGELRAMVEAARAAPGSPGGAPASRPTDAREGRSG